MRLSAPVYRLKYRAKLMAREEEITLHMALDRVAQEEGFASWALLSSRQRKQTREAPVLNRLAEGDLMLLGARPGQGKTLQGLRILLDAARERRRAVFYTLECTEAEVRDRIQRLDGMAAEIGARLEIETSEEISAGYIIAHLAQAPRGTVAVIDYLQILDQQRHKPVLADQVRQLKSFAQVRGIILIFISQIDRRISSEEQAMPGPEHIRMPNPIPTGLFSKACFMQDGQLCFQETLSG